MNKEAFERGFLTAAINAGIAPLTAAILTKQANFDMNTISNWIKANPTAAGAIGGGVVGAGVGAISSDENRGRNALLGGLSGAGLGGLVGNQLGRAPAAAAGLRAAAAAKSQPGAVEPGNFSSYYSDEAMIDRAIEQTERMAAAQRAAQRAAQSNKTQLHRRLAEMQAADPVSSASQYPSSVSDTARNFNEGAVNLGKNIWEGSGRLTENATDALSQLFPGGVPKEMLKELAIKQRMLELQQRGK